MQKALLETIPRGPVSAQPLRNDFGVKPPLAVKAGQVLFEDDIFQNIFGYARMTVDQPAESVVHSQDLKQQGSLFLKRRFY